LVARLLILFWAVSLLSGCATRQEVDSCRQCHTVHFPERGDCTTCDRGDPRSLRQDIAHHGLIAGRFSWFTDEEDFRVKAGEQLLEVSACRRCHRSGDKGNRLASNLDRLLVSAIPEDVVGAIREPAFFMPTFHFSDVQLERLINALLANSAHAPVTTEEMPRTIHFALEGSVEENPFNKHCGGCHRMLSQRFGALGSGQVAPNLSGLFTPFYPANFSSEMKPWNQENLVKWLKNPRSIRPLTSMAPVLLTPAEQDNLLGVLLEPSGNPLQN